MSLDIKIKDLGIGARHLATINQEKQGKPVNEDARLMDKNESFDFSESNEGADFWGAIVEGDFFTAMELYNGERELFVINASNNHATYYLKDKTLHYDFSGMKNGDTTEVTKALEMKDKIIFGGGLLIYANKPNRPMDEKTKKTIDDFMKLWHNRKK